MSADFDVAKLEKLLDVKERWDATEAKKAYMVAKSAFNAECPALEKITKGHNSNYAPLGYTLEQTKKLLGKHGFSCEWKTSQVDKDITVTCIATHIMGHSEKSSLTAQADTSGSKNAIQALGSTVKYLKRYTFEDVMGLSTVDETEDDGIATTVPINASQVKVIKDLLTETKSNTKLFLEAIHAESIDKIAAFNFDMAVEKLNAKLKTMEKTNATKVG
jgi:hypothetical protein